MLTPSWDPVVGTLGGVLDPKVVISRLNTEWSRRQGLTSTDKDRNLVFQTRSEPKCENCGRTKHTKANCWAKGGGQEGQYPDWYEGKKDSHTSDTVKTATDTPIVWSYGYASRPDVWFTDSAATVHVSPNHDDFTSYRRYDKCRIIKAFGRNMVKAVGKGNVLANIKFRDKTTRIELTQVMHVPSVDGKILSLKRLDQKGFEICISGGCVHIMKADETYAEAPLGRELYEVRMKIVLMQDNEPSITQHFGTESHSTSDPHSSRIFKTLTSSRSTLSSQRSSHSPHLTAFDYNAKPLLQQVLLRRSF